MADLSHMTDDELLAIAGGDAAPAAGGGVTDMSDEELFKAAGIVPPAGPPMTAQGKPKPIGKDANADFLREELKNADPFTRNLAGFGVAASDTWEGIKQALGFGDRERIEANKVIRDEAPIAAVAGELAMLLGPMGAVGKSLKGTAAVGGAFGATRPTEAEGVEGLLERGKNAAMDAVLSATGQKIANAGASMLAKKAADNATRKAVNAPRDQVLADAIESGFVAPPASVNPTLWNVTKESFAGKAATAQAHSTRNAAAFEKAARADLGLADDVPLTPEVLQQRRSLAYQVGYTPLARLPAVNWDETFVRGVQALNPRGAGGAVRSPAQGQIDDLLGSLAERGQWTGEQIIHDIRVLRDQAKRNFRNQAPEAQDLAKAQNGAAKLLEDLAERNVIIQGGDPNAVQLMREARTYIAKAHDVEDALIPGGGLNANRWVRKADKMNGEMGKAAKFAAQFPKASQTPQQIAGPGVSKLNAFASFLLGGGGHVAGGPVVGAALATAPLVIPPAMRAQMMTKRAQRNAVRRMYELGFPERAGVNALRVLPYSPALLTEP